MQVRRSEMRRFSQIIALAAQHHRSEEIARGLEDVRSRSAKEIAELEDDRVLAFMAHRVFCSGFSRAQIDEKWPAFEEASWSARCRNRTLGPWRRRCYIELQIF
ncbi:hypothetical protein [Methylosinus sp. Ce-a6]|uniref:hypothetical protein n=1 Tax=Methylosinus sp. Ce-a6 TaxID=2172005 RepID=UPI00135AD0EA|nr:hypothetical protein [Methylosinus sp. Ce-a6]